MESATSRGELAAGERRQAARRAAAATRCATSRAGPTPSGSSSGGRRGRAAEKFHSALVPHAGRGLGRFREVVALGAALRRIGEVAGSRVEADVALLWDWEAWWACDLRLAPAARAALPSTRRRRWHRALTELGATVDVVHPGADLSGYRLVVVPTLYLCSDAAAARWPRSSRGGGHVLVTLLLRDRRRVRPRPARRLPGGVPRAAGRAGRGVRAAAARHDRHAGRRERAPTCGPRCSPAPDAEVVARYIDGPLPGTPALTRRAVGDGVAWYVGTRLDEAATAALADRVTGDAGCDAPRGGRQPGVEVVRRGPLPLRPQPQARACGGAGRRL